MLMHVAVMIKQTDISNRTHYLSLYEFMKANVQVISYTQSGGNPLSVSFHIFQLCAISKLIIPKYSIWWS